MLIDCKFKYAVGLATFFALFTAAPRLAHAGGPDACAVDASSTIQRAIDSGCSQIIVQAGTYHENVVIRAGRKVSIKSVDSAAKTISQF